MAKARQTMNKRVNAPSRAANVLANPGLLNLVMKSLDRKNVHRMAATSKSFRHGATRFYDAKIRELRELEDRQNALRAAIKQVTRRKAGITSKFTNAARDLEDVLAQTFPELEWSTEEVQAVSLVTKVYQRDPANVGSLVLRLATIGEGLWDAMEAKQRNTTWFKDAKGEYNEMGAALQKITLNLNWPFMADGSEAAKYLRIAPSLVKLCDNVLQPWGDMLKVLEEEDENEKALEGIKRSISNLLSKMDDPSLGRIPTSLKGIYRLPPAFRQMGGLSYEQMEALPEKTRASAKRKRNLLAAYT
jgi:hypothetical protein